MFTDTSPDHTSKGYRYVMIIIAVVTLNLSIKKKKKKNLTVYMLLNTSKIKWYNTTKPVIYTQNFILIFVSKIFIKWFLCFLFFAITDYLVIQKPR